MRTLSQTFMEAIFAQHTGEVVVLLVTITHPGLGGSSPIRVSSDPTIRITDDPLVYGTQSRGSNYLYLPMTGLLPDEELGKPPETKIILDNIDSSIVGLLRSTSTPATVKMELVLASDPDYVEVEIPIMDLAVAEYDASSITLSLVVDALTNEPYPFLTFTPRYFPGLF